MATMTPGSNAEIKALDKFSELMIKKIEQVSMDWKKPWFTECCSLPTNLSGRHYNGMNSLVLMMHCEEKGYRHPVFATFDRVEKLNDPETPKEQQVHIKKGEKSFPVFFQSYTCVNAETKERTSYTDYKNLSKEERAKWNVYHKLNLYHVFNVEAQTNIKEARPELYDKYFGEKKEERDTSDFFSIPELDQMIADQSWICPINLEYQDQAYYSISKDAITFPEKNQFKSGEAFASNLFHEMAHSTGRKETLDRLQPSTFGSASYAKEELVAELTAALVCTGLGITKTIKDDSAAYLKNWLDTLKEEPSFIKTVLIDVKKASQVIEGKLNEIRNAADNAA